MWGVRGVRPWPVRVVEVEAGTGGHARELLDHLVAPQPLGLQVAEEGVGGERRLEGERVVQRVALLPSLLGLVRRPRRDVEGEAEQVRLLCRTRRTG